ncbi:hypothetical protein AAZX31_20G061000 [Glycine max]
MRSEVCRKVYRALRSASVSSHVTASVHPSFHCFQLPPSRNNYHL